MGYRSEVAAVIKFTDQVRYATFMGCMKERVIDMGDAGVGNDKEAERTLWGIFDSELTQHDDDLEIRLYCPDTKWYPGYPDVDAMMECLQSAPEVGGSYKFIRIGEEVTDIEVEEEMEYINHDPDFYLSDILCMTSPSIKWG